MQKCCIELDLSIGFNWFVYISSVLLVLKPLRCRLLEMFQVRTKRSNRYGGPVRDCHGEMS